jgi:beta-glucosidase
MTPGTHSDDAQSQPRYLNSALPVAERVRDLIGRMTLAEKVSQMMNKAPAIPRLGIPEYDWWNECLHGVGRAGIATVFPQAIGLAATWDTELMSRIATAISDEARAKHHEFVRQGVRARYTGLTFWSPNINIFRDPRWGRGQETYGEDPYLTARLGVAFVRGLQGDDPKYLKVVATPKHYAVHSGPEADRHHFDAVVDQRDLYETYLPAFAACVQEGGAVSVMGAYNRTNSEPCCASPTLLQRILREKWDFPGYVVSDCGAIGDIYRHHRVAPTPEAAAAMAVKAGCDLECGDIYRFLPQAVEKGLLSEEDIDRALTRLFTARFRLGMFDPPEQVPYAQIPYEVNDCPAHRELALQAARESIVLLKNDNLLPLRRDLRTIAVIGPNADNLDVLLGNYNGTPSSYTTPLAGIQRYLPAVNVLYTAGCTVNGQSTEGFASAVEIARKADVAIMVMGLSPRIEGEEGDSQGDRHCIELPGVQQELIEAVYATGTPVVLVLLCGSAIAIPWAQEHLPAILVAWYPGEEGGTALAEVLFGDVNPSGRLPVTFYAATEDLPPFSDYRMAGRTYRYFQGTPLYPFGFGLSYTTFAYSNLTMPDELAVGKPLTVSATVTNTGDRAGDEVVQLYVSDLDATVPVPIRQLQGIRRVHLAPGESVQVSFTLSPSQFSLIDADGRRVVEPGQFLISVGGGQPEMPNSNAVTGICTMTGNVLVL